MTSVKSIKVASLLLLAFVVNSVKSDDYLSDAEVSCKTSKDVVSCGKFAVLRYIDRASSSNLIVTNTTSPVQFVKIEDDDEGDSLFPEARNFEGAGELAKLIRFVQKRTDKFLKTQGISVPLPDGFKIMDESTGVIEGRGQHKKRGVISLLTLIGVFKLKVLIGLVLLGIFFIKKVILLSAIILPSILHNLKMSCKHIFPHHVSHGEEYHDHDSIYGNYGHSGYSKDWERRYKAAQASQGALTTDYLKRN